MNRKVVVAPDSFKGTLSSVEVCETVRAALREIYPSAEVCTIPVADGGEGTAEAFFAALGGEKVFCDVKTPLGRNQKAFFVVLPDKKAVIEMALASGLCLEKHNDAMKASSYGTGQLIKAALDYGARELLIGIGGSATTDCGTGCLAALGAVFYDGSGNVIEPCGKNLSLIEKTDVSGLDERLRSVKITVLCDVKNPLYGENGASYIYAAQKGATEAEVRILDEGLRHFSKVCSAVTSEDFSFSEGAGAAGGMGFAMLGFFGAELKKGIDTVLEVCDFSEKVKDADLVITGEGRFDSQSLMGKVPFGVAERSTGKRVIVLTGVSEVSEDEFKDKGIFQVIETNPGHLPFESIAGCAKEMLYEAAKKIKL